MPGIQINVLKTPAENDHSLVRDLLKLVSTEERDRFSQFGNRTAGFTFLCARVAIRHCLSGIIGLSPEEIPLSILPSGKPVLKFKSANEDQKPVHFSISHTTEAVATAVANYPIGIDIENPSRKVELASIVKRFFSDAEFSQWSLLPSEMKEEFFFKAWTIKEAWLKMSGDGIAALSDIQVSLSSDSSCSIQVNPQHHLSQKEVFTYSYLAENMVLSVALLGKIAPISLTISEFSSILEQPERQQFLVNHQPLTNSCS